MWLKFKLLYSLISAFRAMKYFPSIHNRLHICYLIHSRQQSTKKATLYKASTHAFSDSHWACKVKDVIKPFVHKAKESHLLNTGIE